MNSLKVNLFKITFITICLINNLTLLSQVITHMDTLDNEFDKKVQFLLGNDLRGETIPAFIARDTNGELFTRENIRSKKITFINFWFESCPPCLAEFGAMEKFYIKNKDRQDFQFVSITFEQDSTIERIRKKYNLTYPIYYLSNDSCNKVRFKVGYPVIFMVDKNLKITYSKGGGSTDPDIEDKTLNYFIQDELDKQLTYKSVPVF